jgi:phenylacetate-CoA ligase
MTSSSRADTEQAFAPPPSSRPSRVYAWAYEHVLFPAWQRAAHGRSIAEHLEEIESSQWLPRVDLDRIQLDRLVALLEHAKAHVPYYQELFANVGFDPRDVTRREHLQDLPLLTKEIIRERYDDLLDPTRRRATIKKGTSGTTGRPLLFEYDDESEAWRQAVRIRSYRWAGFRLGLPTLHYWAQAPMPPRGLRAVKTRLDRTLRREVYVDAIPQDEESLLAAVDVIHSQKPHVIVGYTQATALFARFVIEHGLRDWADIPVICGAEAVLPSDRAAIERAFGPAFETYGSRETMLIAAECDLHRGMHLAEENVFVEIVGTDGRTMHDGEAGDVVVTDLHNFAMPFIRYANGDMATMARAPRCPCGRGLRKLERVEGRRCDTLHDAQGMPIPGMLFIALLARSDDLVRKFQVVQHEDGSVVLRAVPGRGWSERERDRLAARLRGQLHGLPLTVETCDDIPPDPSGKRRPIVVHGARVMQPSSA